MSDVREYRLLPSGLAEAQERVTKRYLVPQLLIIAGVVVVSAFLGTRSGASQKVIGFAVFAGLFITYMAFMAPHRLRKSMSRSWATYVLMIAPDHLLRRQADVPEIRLPFKDVKRIEHLQGRYLRVIGSGKYQVIGIPESIENFQEVLAAVSRIAPIEGQKSDRSLKSILFTAGGFAAYMLMLWSQAPRIVLPLAIIVATLLMWLFVYMQRSPNVSRRNKRASWLYLLFLAFCVLKVLAVFAKTD